MRIPSYERDVERRGFEKEKCVAKSTSIGVSMDINTQCISLQKKVQSASFWAFEEISIYSIRLLRVICNAKWTSKLGYER